MPDQIVFKLGQRQHFIAARTFALGKTGVSVPKGADVMYDGSVAEFGGAEYPVPELRGAIRVGWLVPQSTYDEEDTSAERPLAANIQVGSAVGGNPFERQQRPRTAMNAATESDEREVGNTRNHASAVTQRNTTYKRGTPLNAQGMELQDGVPVRKLKTAAGERAKNQRQVLTGSNAASIIQEAEKEAKIDPGRGITEEEMLERMSPDEAAQYVATKNARKAQYLETDAPVVGKVVSAEKTKKEAGGVTSTVSTSKGSQDIFDATGMDPGKPVIKTIERDGMKFTTTNGPSEKEQPSPRAAEAQKPVMLKDGSVEVRRMIAKQLCPDFPTNYDFAASPRKKLARLQADYEDRPDVIRAVFAAEADDFKATLMSEFPGAFSG